MRKLPRPSESMRKAEAELLSAPGESEHPVTQGHSWGPSARPALAQGWSAG